MSDETLENLIPKPDKETSEPPKNKGGRPKGSGTKNKQPLSVLPQAPSTGPSPETQAQAVAALGMILEAPIALLKLEPYGILKMGPIEINEKEYLIQTGLPVLMKHAGGILESIGPELTFLAALAFVYGPKLRKRQGDLEAERLQRESQPDSGKHGLREKSTQ